MESALLSVFLVTHYWAAHFVFYLGTPPLKEFKIFSIMDQK